MNKVQSIINEYEAVREKERRDLEARKKVLYARVPRLAEIEDALVRLSIEVTRSILSDPHKREALLENLKKKQMDLKIEKAELLSACKYPIDYLDMHYQCKYCKDTGFVENKKCRCYIQKEIALHYRQSNLEAVLKKENFDQFRFDFYSEEKGADGVSPRDNIKTVYQKCIRFTDGFDQQDSSLLLIGRPGLGKTFLCHAIAKDLLDRGRSVIYQTAPDLIDLIRKYKFDFDNEDINAPYLNELYSCDLLIIDDLGTELSTQFSNLAIYNILNKRMLSGKKMVIATNLNIDEFIKLYSERIFSRVLGNFDMCKFIGDDIRLKMHRII